MLNFQQINIQIINLQQSGADYILVVIGHEQEKIKTTMKNNPNVVKIWLENKQVRKFSRKNDFVSRKDFTKGKHLGLYAFRVSFLKEFISMDRTPNEIKEELEQLRALDNGKKILAIKSKRNSYLGIDTPLDLDLARSRIIHDKD